MGNSSPFPHCSGPFLNSDSRFSSTSGKSTRRSAWSSSRRIPAVPWRLPGLANRVKEILPDALEVRLEYPRIEEPATSEDGAAEPGADSAAVPATATDPVQRLEAYYRREHGADLPAALAELFRRLYEEVVRETA